MHAESLMGVDLCLHFIIMIGLSGVGGHCVADGNAHRGRYTDLRLNKDLVGYPAA